MGHFGTQFPPLRPSRTFTAMPDVKETEDQLIQRAQRALSRCNWEIGECAAAWTKRFARGRTDADFGAAVGLSGDQVYQRRRVWETFHDVHERYEELKWSHFYAALNWDDSAECLQWAQDMSATVAEMKAWRRAQHGEDLSSPAEESPAALSAVEVLSLEAGTVRDPDLIEREPREPGANGSEHDRETLAVAGAARSSEAADDYAPFGATARGAGPVTEERRPPDAAVVVKRIAGALDRCNASLTPEVLDACRDASDDVRARLKGALKEISGKLHSVLD